MMKRLFNSLVLSALLVVVSGFFNSARAEQIACTGDYFFYHFEVTGKSVGRRIDGKMDLLVTQGGRLIRKGAIAPSSSDIAIGKYLKFAGGDASGGATLEATFNGSTYTGILAVNSPEGGANVDVECTAR